MLSETDSLKSDRAEDFDFDFGTVESDSERELDQKIKNYLQTDVLIDIAKAVHISVLDRNKYSFDTIVHRIISLYKRYHVERDINDEADGVRSDLELTWTLLIIVKSSGSIFRDLINIHQVASRAMTILNRANVSFTGMNLSNIQAPVVDLSYAICDGTQLQNANLENARLHGAWLKDANFSQASMKNALFGEYPNLKVPYPVDIFCASPDRSHLAVSFMVIVQTPIMIYSLETQDIIQTITGIMNISALMYSRDSQQLASSNENIIQLWNPKTGELLKILSGHTASIYSIAYSPNNELLISASRDTTIKLWDTKTGNLLREFIGHTGSIKILDFFHNGNLFFSGSRDNTIKIWDLEHTKAQMTLEGHNDDITVIRCREDNQQLVSGSHDQTVILWDLNLKDNSYQLKRLTGHTGAIRDLSYSPDNLQLASGGDDYKVFLWERSTGKLQYTLDHYQGVNCLLYNQNGSQLASGSNDNIIRLWDPKTGKLQQSLNGHSHGISFLTYESSVGRLISSSGGDKTIRWWDIVNTETYSPPTDNNIKHDAYVAAIAYRPDGNQIASGDGNNSIILWKVENNYAYPQKVLKKHSLEINTLAYRFDSKQLASGSNDNNIILWDSKGTLYKTLRGHQHYVMNIVYRPDGKQLASASGDSTIKLWDTESGECIYSLKGHSELVTTLAYSSNGARLASGSHDNKVIIWDPTNGSLLRILAFNQSGHHVNSVCFKDDWHIAAYSSNGLTEGVAISWNTNDGKLVESTTGVDQYLRQWVSGNVDPDEIMNLEKVMVSAWSSDKNYFATGGFDATVRLFRVIENNIVQLLWSSHQSTSLYAKSAIFIDTVLSENNRALLKKHNAITEKLLSNEEIQFRIQNASFYYDLNNLDQAIRIYEELVLVVHSEHPKLSYIYNNLAGLYYIRGLQNNNTNDFDLADTSFKNALNLHKAATTLTEYGQFLYNRGLTVNNFGLLEQASSWLKQACNAKQTRNSLSYGIIEINVVPLVLREYITQETPITIKPIILATYLLIKCQLALGQLLTAKDQIEVFEALINNSEDILDRALFDEVETSLAITMSLENPDEKTDSIDNNTTFLPLYFLRKEVNKDHSNDDELAAAIALSLDDSNDTKNLKFDKLT